MKDIKEMVKGMGPVRAKEFKEAYNVVEAAKGKLAELQETLAKQKVDQAALAPSVMVTASANVATLAQGVQLQSAHGSVIAHLEKEAIPAAQNELNRVARTFNSLQDGHLRKQQHIAEQQRIIAKAQAEIDKAAEWLDT